MKYPKLEGICKKCYGCNQLELETFKGKYKCENFVDGGKEDDICIRSKRESSWQR